MSSQILVVEDNPQDAELFLRAMQKRIPPTEAHLLHDGEELLEYLGTIPNMGADTIALIVLDLKLPRVSGTEVLKRLKGNEQTRTIPIVVLASSAEQRDITECYRLGANSYVIKPVDYPGFEQIVLEIAKYWMTYNRTNSFPEELSSAL